MYNSMQNANTGKPVLKQIIQSAYKGNVHLVKGIRLIVQQVGKGFSVFLAKQKFSSNRERELKHSQNFTSSING